MPRLIRDGRLMRPALGVTAAPPSMNRSLGLPKGVALVSVSAAVRPRRPVSSRSAAGNWGSSRRDVITAIDGEPIETADDMFTVLERLSPGDACTLTVWRAGDVRKRTVKLVASEQVER